MNAAVLQDMLIGTAVIGAFLLIGAFLRARVPLFRRWLLPASVIGGIAGLLLGPPIWGARAPLPFPDEWMALWEALPVVLIVPVFSAAPLGSSMDPAKKRRRLRDMAPIVLLMTGIFALGGSIQYILGYGVNLAITAVRPETGLYRTFGYELPQGFAGGHGTATAVGSILKDFGLPWWQTSQGVALTMATIGLIGGMLLGIYFINRASRKGETQLLGNASVIPKETLQGYTTDIGKQRSLGRETTAGSSIETITVHLTLMLIASGLAYLLSGRMRVWLPSVFLPVWFYALLIMYAINFVLLKLKLNWLIDTKVKARITGTLSDFAITAAIMTLPFRAVSAYIVPIIIMSVIGFAGTYLVTFPLYRKTFRGDFPFERAIMSWGVNTGVMITGMTLLKITDPEYESPVLNDFSMGFALMSLFSLVISPIDYNFIARGSTLANFFWNSGVGLFYAAIAFIGCRMTRRPLKAKKG
ncbi:MAG: sodium:glutamate symporter [Fastidiosipila sp.]|nr:sodium:glutamate symporter [Fastidiosipila sp.]HPX92640.1 sodium/glutamate symporter [Bacillota bacterium]